MSLNNISGYDKTPAELLISEIQKTILPNNLNERLLKNNEMPSDSYKDVDV